MLSLLKQNKLVPAGSDPLGFLSSIPDPAARARIERLSQLFDRLRPGVVPEADRDLVPRILHRIWLGGPPPPRVVRFGESWRRFHPGWDFVLWDEARVADARFDSADLVNRASCFGQKSDLLRAEILNRYGGVYVDTDFECFRPIDTLVRRYEFFASTALLLQAHLGWPALWTSPLIVNNAFIGARANHPILIEYLRRVRREWKSDEDYRICPNELSIAALLAIGGRRRADHVKEVGLRTYLPFHEVTADLAGEENRRDVVLPHPYFHASLGGGLWPLFVMPAFWRHALRRPLRMFNVGRYDHVDSAAYANHVSRRTWLKRPAGA